MAPPSTAMTSGSVFFLFFHFQQLISQSSGKKREKSHPIDLFPLLGSHDLWMASSQQWPAGATVNEPPRVLSFDYIDMCGIEWTGRVFTGPSREKKKKMLIDS